MMVFFHARVQSTQNYCPHNSPTQVVQTSWMTTIQTLCPLPEKFYIEVLLLKISTGGYEIQVTDVNTLILSSFILQIKVCQILNITKKNS